MPATGDGEFVASGKYGAAWSAYRIEEGGAMGPVEWNVNVPYFDAYGNPKTKVQLNADVLAEIEQQRSNQGCTATPNPLLALVDFFPDMS
jgi:hypothetical protein